MDRAHGVPWIFTIVAGLRLHYLDQIKTGAFCTEIWTAIVFFLSDARRSLLFTFTRLYPRHDQSHPMEWGYPRTVEGFWHAIKRGQYDKTPSNGHFHPGRGQEFMMELKSLFRRGWPTLNSLVAMFFAVLPLFFIFQKCKSGNAPGSSPWPPSIPFWASCFPSSWTRRRDRQSNRPGQGVLHRLARSGWRS